jgi:hypothetical protein
MLFLRVLTFPMNAGEGENSQQALGDGQGKRDQLTQSITQILSSLQPAINYHYARACTSWAVGSATCATCGRSRYYVVSKVRIINSCRITISSTLPLLQKVKSSSCARSPLGEDYLHPKSLLITGVDPPPPPNPRPRPPPPLPQPQRPPVRAQPASDALWDRAGAKGCTLGWGSK